MKREIGGLFTFLVLLTIISAASCPTYSMTTYYGEVSYNHNLIMGDYPIAAVMGGEVVGSSVLNNGQYTIDVSPCAGSSSGTVTFVVNGIEALETVEYSIDNWGYELERDLTLNELPPIEEVCINGYIDAGEECDDGNNVSGDGCSSCEVDYGYSCTGQPSTCVVTAYCGDGSCNNGETCSSCTIDCGSCAVSNGGGSSGGGGSSSSLFTCGDWGECADGVQARTCVDQRGNYADRIEYRACEGDLVDLTGEENPEEETRGGLTGFITGAVTGVVEFVKSWKTWLALLFILLVVIAFILVQRARKKNAEQQ